MFLLFYYWWGDLIPFWPNTAIGSVWKTCYKKNPISKLMKIIWLAASLWISTFCSEIYYTKSIKFLVLKLLSILPIISSLYKVVFFRRLWIDRWSALRKVRVFLSARLSINLNTYYLPRKSTDKYHHLLSLEIWGSDALSLVQGGATFRMEQPWGSSYIVFLS